MSQFAIEKGVPIPPSATGPKSGSKYPYREMEVGDSFFVPGGKRSTVSGVLQSRHARPHGKFTLRTVDGGVRVWRIA